MRTECKREKLEFQPCGARQVIGEFNVITITSDGGMLPGKRKCDRQNG